MRGPWMRGSMPLRRTMYYLYQGKVFLRDEVKIFTLAFHRTPDIQQQGAREFEYWHWGQLQFRNPHVQFVKMDGVCVTPFALAILKDGREVAFDLECRTKEEITTNLIRTLGKTPLVRRKERMEKALLERNPVEFGIDCDKQCICELQGQHPCPSLMYAPKHLQGSWRWNHALYKPDWPKPYPTHEGSP